MVDIELIKQDIDELKNYLSLEKIEKDQHIKKIESELTTIKENNDKTIWINGEPYILVLEKALMEELKIKDPRTLRKRFNPKASPIGIKKKVYYYNKIEVYKNLLN